MAKISFYCDGGSRGNPGPAAIGFVVLKNGKKIKTFSRKIGRATNNVAEYQAVLAALEFLKENHRQLATGEKDALLVDFYLDSELVTRQLLGLYKVRNVNLKKLVLAVKDLEKDLPMRIFYHFISREKNQSADFLVNQALGKKRIKF